MKLATPPKILLRSYEAVVPLPVGSWQLGIRTDGQAVLEIDFIDEEFERITPSAVAIEAAQQLHCYVDNPRWRFTLALKLNGTPFQQRVWAALQVSREVRDAVIVAIICDRGDRYLSTGVFPAE